MKAREGTRSNHLNDGGGGSHGLGAQHSLTRLSDPEDISGDGNPGTHEPLKRVTENRGGAPTHGMAATHHRTRINDAHELETDIVDKD